MTNKPDFTAWFVIQGFMAALHRLDFKNDINNQTTISLLKPLVIESSKTRIISKLVSVLPYSLQYKIGDFVTNKGRMRHFYLRKQEVEKNAKILLENEEISQVVILGAGLDVLSLKLSNSYPNIKFIEIDTKETQGFKTSSFAKHGVIVPSNVEFVEGDLRNPLPDILSKSKLFVTGNKTLWIAEGLLMFIPEDSVIRIFSEIKKYFGNSYIIFTTLPDKKQTSTINYFLQKFFLHKENCPINWTIPFEKIKFFMETIEFKATKNIKYSELNKIDNCKQKPSITRGENFHIFVT